MCCPFHAILNPSSVKCTLQMRSQCLYSEKFSHLLKGKYIFFNVLVPGQRVNNTNKKKHYIDNNKTIKLAGKSISLYNSIVSQVALSKIHEPHSEWRWPRNIRNKFEKVENMPKTQKSTSYTSFTKEKVFRFFPRCKGFHAVVHKATKNIDWPSFFIRVSVGFY